MVCNFEKHTLTSFVITYGMHTEKDLEEAQRKKEYGYTHPTPDDYNEVYDDDGYIEDYPEEDGDDELFLSMDEIEGLRNLSHDKLLNYACCMAEQYREMKMRVVPSLKKRIEHLEATENACWCY